jgi:hypothetical protein
MNKEVSITLTENDWGQIIDGLTCRAEQYELTAKYHAGESVRGEILAVSDADEARELALWYRRLVEQIRGQLKDAENEVG